MTSDLLKGEKATIEKYITKESIVFDVGGCFGEWSLAVLSKGLSSHVHIFEPTPKSYSKLLINLKQYCNKITINNIALYNNIGSVDFWI